MTRPNDSRAALYVPGKLTGTEIVIIDVGTGYYVKKARPFSSHYEFIVVLTITASAHLFQRQRSLEQTHRSIIPPK